MSARPAVVHVLMGQVALGQGPAILQATLGSCVGIALVWRQRSLCALAHCLLPCALQPEGASGGRYVDGAVRSMLRLLQAADGQHLQIEAHLGGGANMSRRAPPRGASPAGVGQLNVEAAEQVLRELRIPLLSRDVGGFRARQMVLDCATATVRVVEVPPPQWRGDTRA